jgi:hypothetical protein
MLSSLLCMDKALAINVGDFKSMCKTQEEICSMLVSNTTTAVSWAYAKGAGELFYCEKAVLKESDIVLATKFIKYTDRIIPGVFDSMKFSIAYFEFLKDVYPINSCLN